MTDEPKDPTPPKQEEPDDPVADLKQGVNLLFRAAKKAAQTAKDNVKRASSAPPPGASKASSVEGAVKGGLDELHKTFERLQSEKLEGAIKTSLQEIGRALGNVAQTLERELTHHDEPPKDDEKKP
jgi:hypothetical protein